MKFAFRLPSDNLWGYSGATARGDRRVGDVTYRPRELARYEMLS